MVAVPEPVRTTAKEIYAWYEQQKEEHREHLGASQIGHQCDRYLWYVFRWVNLPTFNGRLLRLFGTGKREEPRVYEELRGIGVELHTEDSGKQIECRDASGHFGGSIDGIGRGFPEAPKTWAILEVKTHGSKSYHEVASKGVETAKPQHYAQMQTYMGLMNVERALYFAVNKDTDEIYVEWVHYNEADAKALQTRATYIIARSTPPERLSNDPANWVCKMCDFYKTCHHGGWPEANCRTCSNSTPVESGQWTCGLHGFFMSADDQRKGCGDHVFIPPLVPAKPVDGGVNYVEYEARDGTTFKNGPGHTLSASLSNSTKATKLKRKAIGDNNGVPFDDPIPFD